MRPHPHPQMFFRDGTGDFQLAPALDFALALARALQRAQDGGLLHGQLCLSNILLEPGGGLSLRMAPRDTLAYLAPEQTGRMNRKVDQRSDLYAVGAILYELCTGRLPFPASDLMALVHGHIARRPPAPAALNPALPPLLGQLILRLLAKDAEQRYQSAAGLVADLAECQRMLAEEGALTPFPLGREDRAERLQIPERLYGREAEAARLLQAFGRAAQGNAELVLVSGYAGIGKSALVYEIHQPVLWRRGYFAAGKFDQFKRNVPYSAFHEALRELVRQVLAEDEAASAAWRVRIAEALGPNAQMMIESVPELRHLIGAQPPTPRSFTTPAAYSHALLKLVSVFARAEHPLVLFLDDLQWADSASLRLLSQLLKDLEDPCLLLIGAYRDTGDYAMGAEHPLAQTIARLQAEAPVQQIALEPLALANVVELASDTFNVGSAAVRPLAELVWRKTMGNPFFVSQFLRSLHHEGLLRLEQGGWRWDMAAIGALDITDNVVDLLTRDLARLPAATREILALAACIGNRFEEDLLATLSGGAETQRAAVHAALLEAAAAGLIRAADGLVAAAAWQFQHDRVQQAAYEGIPAASRGAVHLRVGQALLAGTRAELMEERIFDIVPQLNQGRALLQAGSERERLAELNLLAAKRAREAAALDVHLEHVRIAEELGAVAQWRTRPVFMHALTMEKVSAAFARGDYVAMAGLCRLVTENADSAEQVIPAQLMLLRCYGSTYKVTEMLGVGMELLAIAGIRPPRKLGKWHIRLARLRLWLALKAGGVRDIEALAELPEPHDPVYLRELHATTALLGFGLGYLADARLLEWLSLYLIRKAVRHGVSPQASYAFTVWGNCLLTRYRKPVAAYKFSKVGAVLGARGSLVTLSTSTLFEGAIRHRIDPLREALQPLESAVLRTMERGDRTGAAVAMATHACHMFHAGLPLAEVLEKTRRYVRVCRRMDYPAFLLVLHTCAQMVARLAGETPEELAGLPAPEALLESRRAAKDNYGQFYVCAEIAVVEYLLGDPARALAAADTGLSLPGYGTGVAHSGYTMFYGSLAELALARQAGRAPAGLAARQRRLATWARHAPANYLGKWQIVEAERLLQAGREAQALALFNEAMAAARREGFAGDEAVACELLGQHFLRRGREVEARAWLEEAWSHYRRWGAHAVAAALLQRHPMLLARVAEQDARERLDNAPRGAQALDLASVIRAGQALSGEIQLDRLLQQLMRILIENAGAQHGVLLLQRDEALTVQAKLRAPADEQDAAHGARIEVLQGTPADDDASVCMAIVNYVRRTNAPLLLGDAQKDARFAGDAHVRGGVRSVLCLPLSKQGQLAGILYLENNLAADAFTPARTELLHILSAQAAISLENASLYNELEQKIAARTAMLSQRNEELSATLASLRAAQKQLVESEKLASLGQLVAGVAHEINTPIGIAVTGASTLAEHTTTLAQAHQDGTLRRSDVDKYLEAASVISKLLMSNMERAAALIQSFKAVAVDQTSEERRRFRLRGYIEDVLLNLSPLLRRAEHRVTLDCDPDILVDTYPGALAQVVTNLVTNALMHAFEGRAHGNIRIGVAERDGELLELRFADDGVGIAPAVRGKIFEPFYTTRRGRGGSGLGLNIVYNLVSGSLQGRIDVDSEVGQGTTFTIVFPRTAPPAQRSAAQTPAEKAYVH